MNMDFAALSKLAKEAGAKAKVAATRMAEQAKERLEDTEGNKQMMQQFANKVATTLDGFIDEAPGPDNSKIIDLTYVTDRFIAMGFPWDGRSSAGSAAARQTANPIKAVAAHLRSYHEGHYMVLNVSEEQYDYGIFDMNVLEFKFPGHPAPPLAGQEKRAKFPTSKAPISAVFHSFWLIFGRAIISRNGLAAWMLFPERARAEHSR